MKNYIDLTNNKWKQNYLVGNKISKIPLTKTQKKFNLAAAINVPLPFTFSPITSPILIKIGRKLSIKEKVKIK